MIKQKILPLILFLAILAFIFIIKLLSPPPFLNIRYERKDGWACLEFREDGDYTMYDCDSEPTNYFFDSENECIYKYLNDKKEINFKCEASVWDIEEKNIKIENWTRNKITFTIDGKTETFYAK